MNKSSRQEQDEAKRQQAAENAADTEHPSHYQARKEAIRNEPELRREAGRDSDSGRAEAAMVDAGGEVFVAARNRVRSLQKILRG